MGVEVILGLYLIYTNTYQVWKKNPPILVGPICSKVDTIPTPIDTQIEGVARIVTIFFI